MYGLRKVKLKIKWPGRLNQIWAQNNPYTFNFNYQLPDILTERRGMMDVSENVWSSKG
jgi:hypothetical protein